MRGVAAGVPVTRFNDRPIEAGRRIEFHSPSLNRSS